MNRALLRAMSALETIGLDGYAEAIALATTAPEKSNALYLARDAVRIGSLVMVALRGVRSADAVAVALAGAAVDSALGAVRDEEAAEETTEKETETNVQAG